MRITNCYFVCFIVFIEFVNTDIGIGGQIPNIQRLNNQFPRSSKELIETAREENNITAADCHQLADNEQCPCLIRNKIAFCCNIYKENKYNCQKDYNCGIRSVNIFNSDLDHEHFNNEFFNHLGLCSHSIEELRVQNSSLENITVGHQMTELQILDLRQNEAVDTLNEPQTKTIKKLYLSDNYWPCVDYTSRFRESSLELGVGMSWLLRNDWSSKWVDVNNTFCSSFYWHSHSLVYFLKFTQKTLSGCPSRCDCEVADEERRVSMFDITDGEDYVPSVMETEGFKVNVFCTDLGLTSMPVSLPPDTVYLNLQNNQIRSLESMSHLNPDYKHVEKLVLNNNSITSLSGLETSWLHKTGPVLMDLRNNFIRELHTTSLEPMLYKASMKHHEMWGDENSYYLADNPWSCNCHNIKTIQEFLNKYSNLIEDTEYMQCVECDCAILYLDYKEMCASTKTDNMIWIIVIEVTMLTLVLVKLTWDCVQYRRTGHLPWVARHMCWSVPGISRSRWSPRLPNICSTSSSSSTTSQSSSDTSDKRIVSKGSSGYITCSATSSNSEGASRPDHVRGLPGEKESSVVRFI